MIKIVLIVLLFCSFISCQNKTKEQKANQVTYSDSNENVMETEYPWKKSVTEKAVKAIEKSIDNMKLPSDERDFNFPDTPGPFNVPFILDKKCDFQVIGYSHSESKPEIYLIEFRPKDEAGPGPRITVEINIETEEAIRVFMQADA